MSQRVSLKTAGDEPAPPASEPPVAPDEALQSLLRGPSRAPSEHTIAGAVIGELLALATSESQPLLAYPGQPRTSAVQGRSTIDLHAAHIGAQVVLVFERGDPSAPVVVGVLSAKSPPPADESLGMIEVDADGKRMLISARQELVLQCGKARITLTKAGKVLIEGTYVSSQSTGVNRVKGGSVHLN